MKTFKTGLVVGKFYPPHRGDKYLIETTLTQCDEVSIVLFWREGDSIPGQLRAQWLKTTHPTARVVAVKDSGLPMSDVAGEAAYLLKILGFAPDAVFTSEEYGGPYAQQLGSKHVLVDQERTHVPISATMIRANPHAHSEFLEPHVRAHFACRVALVGAESTGKTTLAMDLARHYKTTWVPEYGGRMYAAGRMFLDNTPWRTEEFISIIKKQVELEDSLAELSNGVLICDTEALQTGVWHERYIGVRSKEIEEFAVSRPYALYILAGDEVPFVQDGMRDSGHLRHSMHKTFLARLRESQKKFIVVRGTPQERLAQAVQAIESLRGQT